MIQIPYDHSGRPRPEQAWLDKNAHHALINLERKYSDIPWLPLAMPRIVPDDLEQFVEYFKNNAIDGLRNTSSYDDPGAKPTDPASSWNTPDWRTLEIYRNPLSTKWFGTDTIKNQTVDARALFPELYEQIFDLLPFKELFFIRFWSNTRIIRPHRDQDWSYNLPLACRTMIYDPNPEPTIYTSKMKGNGERHYIDLPDDTNSFAFNNSVFWHGADHHGLDKILMVVAGIPDVDKLERLLESSVAKYNPKRVYNNSQRYTVYNITSKAEPSASPHSEQDIKDLYTLLLTAPEVVNVEEHFSGDQLRSELRVIFWNQDAYYTFSNRVQDQYQAIIQRLNQNYINQTAEFTRYTSAENYHSEFPEKVYPDSNRLIAWTLIDYFKHWVIENIIPVGKVKDYIGKGEFVDAPVLASRFFKEKTGNVVRLLPDKKSMENFPTWMAYNFEHAVQYAIKRNPYVYHRFTKLCNDVENLVSEYITECEHAAVLMGHNSLGEKINVHTHRLSANRVFTLTVMVRLTFDDNPVNLEFYSPKAADDVNLPFYYQEQEVLKKSIEGQTPVTISTDARASLFVFNAGHIPHSVNYNNDLYLYFIYDNITFREGMLEKIKQQSQISKFTEYTEDKHLYFFDITN